MSETNVTRLGVKVHPLAEAFPMIQGAELDALRVDIAANGVLNPIVWSHDGQTLIDGRNRLDVWLTLGRALDTIPSQRLSEGADEVDAIVSLNLTRRQMSVAQKALTAARSLPTFSALAKQRMANRGSNQGYDLGTAADQAGSKFGVSRKSVYAAVKILDYPNVAAQVDAGALTIPQALEKIANLRNENREATSTPHDLKWREGDVITITPANVSAMRVLHRQLSEALLLIDDMDHAHDHIRPSGAAHFNR